MEPGRVVIGIHGLANKPPADEKTRWWKAAIAEGLARNEGLVDPNFAFEFVYWADLRYETPLSEDDNGEPYRPYAGAGPLPGGEDAPSVTVKDMLAPVYAGIDLIEGATGVTLVDDVILEHRFDDLWNYHSEAGFARDVRARLIERLRAYRDRRILLVAHSMGSVIAYDALRLLEREDPPPDRAPRHGRISPGPRQGQAQVRGRTWGDPGSEQRLGLDEPCRRRGRGRHHGHARC